MQQPVNQHEQLGSQQAMSQQMVLCPVRFVYETQILVPPGDQVQPNQTFFINPQNPPPWMQNRTMPNQVLYLQQLPSNIMQSAQQPMDQNQLYLHQNYGNFQIQQQMLTQNPNEIRPTMQLTNIVPNIVHNVQQTLSNDRNITPNNMSNINQMQSNAQNQVQNQINLANARIPQVNQTVEVPRQVYMNMRPQINQQANLTRPVIAMNQIQNNMQIPQTLTNMSNLQLQPVGFGQNLMPNVGQSKSTPSPNIANIPRVVQPANNYTNQAINYPNMQSVSKVRDTTPVEINKSMNNTTAQSVANSMPILSNIVGSPLVNTRNFIPNYSYRPIQPRPQIRHVNSNITHIQSKPVPVQNASTYTIVNSNKSNTSQNVINNNPINAYFNTQENNLSRKRKSESPDGIQKKIALTTTIKQNYNVPHQSITVTKLSNEIGVNTSPVHRVDNKSILSNNAMLQINPNSAHLVKMVNKVSQPEIHLIQNTVASDVKLTEVNKTSIPAHLIEKEKFIRNTVFTQARGRLLNDKNSVDNEIKTLNSDIVAINDSIQSTESKTGCDIQNKIDPKPVAVSELPINTPVVEKKEVKKESSHSVAGSTITIKQELEMQKEELNMNKEINEVKEDKLQENDKIHIKQERDFNILTHVVDGYVIQESNIAFPIRKPLKEKTIFANTPADHDKFKDEFKVPIDLPLLPLHYLHLNNDAAKKAEEKKEEVNEKGNPFLHVQHTTVKLWTIEELSKHLSTYEWNDTGSVLQEHEIDGESLFLVSRTQLLNIGVSEDHAEIICEFVKS